ncbi:MAG: hypothetical protein C6P37_07375 [Caldibacillus debilis]|uniref:Uncharacterized protein n=1 Tax=Caldibacillus debilis TaxID=301148 RepID=A0A3E0K598_9BACI|nr:hypothetical protein [Bacillaceae bacterium]REJ29047.1 MAG: hypothetical protein C6P37_07375 [Caldibacillus debilis]
MKCGKRNFPHDPPFLPAAFQAGKGRGPENSEKPRERAGGSPERTPAGRTPSANSARRQGSSSFRPKKNKMLPPKAWL